MTTNLTLRRMTLSEIEANLRKIALSDELASVGVTDKASAEALAAQVKDAETHRKGLIEEVLSAATRTYGDAFDRELWIKTLNAASIEDVKAFAAEFRGDGKLSKDDKNLKSFLSRVNNEPEADAKLSGDDKNVQGFLSRVNPKQATKA